MKWYM